MYAFETNLGSTLVSAGIRLKRSFGCFLVDFLAEAGPSGAGACAGAVVIGGDTDRLRFFASGFWGV